ncbi:S8 family serine peptidase [Anaerolineales bacterium HSG25]|nr:S8 family serine peptidase [Anaerolineales bacterium HSG25]
MKISKLLSIVTVLAMAIIIIASSAQADEPVSPKSHRLIIELETPPLAAQESKTGNRLDVRSATARNHIARLKQEQNSFARSMQQVLPRASVSHYINEHGESIPATYQVVFNGLSVDLSREPRFKSDDGIKQARQALSNLPGVKHVYLEQLYQPNLYTSTTLINAPLMWNNTTIGGQNNAGQGIKIASIDAGLHKDAPMFDGTGYSYPTDFPEDGLGLTENNNGKIIVSRTYFRSWDPPLEGEDKAWPGPKSSAHGNHTAAIAGGNLVDAEYQGLSFPGMSGVAPKAWLMSYRTDYASVNQPDGLFYTTEILMALEDAVKDGADVINNSWGLSVPSEGGEYDPTDNALINASKAGVFIIRPAGNSGSGKGTVEAPSPDYMTVASSTSSGNVATGSFGVSAPEPVSNNLRNIEFAEAKFGPKVSEGSLLEYEFVTALAVDPDNFQGCNPWPADALKGKALVVSRGPSGCWYGRKVVEAEKAGAIFVVVYNNVPDNEDRGGLIDMSDSKNIAKDVTISAIFMKKSDGDKVVDWYTNHKENSKLRFSKGYIQVGNTPDRIDQTSGRGPGVGNVLKPDIAAPGVNILSQGEIDNQVDNKHVVYGQASGTSMAAPHVAGAAALLRQIHPDWSNADIKSALMSTAKYLEIYNHDNTPAQPLDMGAGRLDLTHAADPGLILNPPSLSYGLVTQDMTKTIQVALKSVADTTETYALSTLYTGGGYTAMTSLSGFTVTPESVTLESGGTAMITVTFTTAISQGLGDNQGYIVLKGTSHDVHLPAWARVIQADKQADILLMDNDGSGAEEPATGVEDYQDYYTTALRKAGFSYEVWDIDAQEEDSPLIPDTITLMTYKTIIYVTGNNSSPLLSEQDLNVLSEYLNSGGTMIAMGQNLAAALDSNKIDEGQLFYSVSLGANWLQESVTNSQAPSRLIAATQSAPSVFQEMNIDVYHDGDGAKKNNSIDEFMGQPSFIDVGDPTLPIDTEQYVSLFSYPGDNHEKYEWTYDGETRYIDGVVGTSNRMQPSLERPKITYQGRSIYTGFGLEGVNNSGFTERDDLLRTFLNWLRDEPQVTLSRSSSSDDVFSVNFEAKFSSNIDDATVIGYRWDFGDDSGYVAVPITMTQVTHRYADCEDYTVRVEATDNYGNRTVEEMPFSLANCQTVGTGGQFEFTNSFTLPTVIEVPPNIINDNSTLAFSSTNTVSQSDPANLKFAGGAFSLKLYENGQLKPILLYSPPLTVTINYTDTDTLKFARDGTTLDESTLVLRYWRESKNEWSDLGITMIGTPANNHLTATIGYLGEFAIFGQVKATTTTPTVYLPMVVK